MAWFSFDAFPNFLHWPSQKTGLKTVWEIAVVSEVWIISANYGKFYSHLGIAVKEHLLFSNVW